MTVLIELWYTHSMIHNCADYKKAFQAPFLILQVHTYLCSGVCEVHPHSMRGHLVETSAPTFGYTMAVR